MVVLKKLSNDDLYEFVWQSGVDKPPKTRKQLIAVAKKVKNNFR